MTARVNGVAAIDEKSADRSGDRPRVLGIAYPGSEPVEVVLQLENARTVDIAVTARHALPQAILDDYEANWPGDAQPVFGASRAEVVEEFSLGGN
jgi:hypothetical protein